MLVHSTLQGLGSGSLKVRHCSCIGGGEREKGNSSSSSETSSEVAKIRSYGEQAGTDTVDSANELLAQFRDGGRAAAAADVCVGRRGLS